MMPTLVESDKDLVHPKRLENIKDSPGYFHIAQKITMHKSIRMHEESEDKEYDKLNDLTRLDIYKIKAFIEKDLHDYSYGK